MKNINVNRQSVVSDFQEKFYATHRSGSEVMVKAHDFLWGEAAIFLSLDCADTILELLLGFNLPTAVIRKLIREAIIRNRKIKPSAIAKMVQESVMQRSTALWYPLEEFVESKFAGIAREWRQEEVHSLKFFDAVNFNTEKCAALSEILSVEDLRRKVNEMLDNALAHKIYDCVVENDRRLAMNNVSDWDREMMERHSNMGLNVVPLKIFVDTFELGQKVRIYHSLVSSQEIEFIEPILEQ